MPQDNRQLRIRLFCRSERLLGTILVTSGMCTAGIAIWFYDQQEYMRYLPGILIIAGFLFTYGMIIRLMAVERLRKSQSGEDAVTYLQVIEKHVRACRNWRGKSLWMSVCSIMALVAVSLITILQPFNPTILTMTLVSTLSAIGVMLYIFRLEIHHHEITRGDREAE